MMSDNGLHDGDLIRYLDGELDDAGRARVEAAAGGDSAVGERLETLRRRGGQLRGLLKETDPPVPNPKPQAMEPRPAADVSGWLLRAAAVILVLAGVFSLVPPLRAWVVSGWDRVTASSPEEPATHLLDAPDTANVSFASTSDSFDFELVVRQLEGTIRIRTGDVDVVQAVMITRSGTEELMPLPGGLRIINVQSSVADYDVIIPERIRLVRVVIDAVRVEEYSTRSENGGDRTFPAGR